MCFTPCSRRAAWLHPISLDHHPDPLSQLLVRVAALGAEAGFQGRKGRFLVAEEAAALVVRPTITALRMPLLHLSQVPS